MPTTLLLRFDAPLMSFGGVLADEHGFTDEVPSASMLTGLLANALGYDHRETARIERLQARLRFGARCDRPGQLLIDYQTVDLGQPYLAWGWTTWRRPEERAGGSSRSTHIRHRHYWADAVYTVALRLDPAGEAPDVAALVQALGEPERPLFLGRKPCIPATGLVLGLVDAPSLIAALISAPALRSPRGAAGALLKAWWPTEEGEGPEGIPSRLLPLPAGRDWENQVHVGRNLLREGLIQPREEHHGP